MGEAATDTERVLGMSEGIREGVDTCVGRMKFSNIPLSMTFDLSECRWQW